MGVCAKELSSSSCPNHPFGPSQWESKYTLSPEKLDLGYVWEDGNGVTRNGMAKHIRSVFGS